MKTDKFFYKTDSELKLLLSTKMRLREVLANKVSVYDLAIRELKEELLKRVNTPKK